MGGAFWLLLCTAGPHTGHLLRQPCSQQLNITTVPALTCKMACWCALMQARLLMAPTAASLPAGPDDCGADERPPDLAASRQAWWAREAAGYGGKQQPSPLGESTTARSLPEHPPFTPPTCIIATSSGTAPSSTIWQPWLTSLLQLRSDSALAAS